MILNQIDKIRLFLKKIIIAILTNSSKRIIRRFNPFIIVVMGSVGKTSTKDVLGKLINNSRASIGSYNTDIGIHLAIFKHTTPYRNPIKWLYVLVMIVIQSFFTIRFPKYLILEVGLDHPGDIRALQPLLRPDVIVFTPIPDIPVHIENFASREELVEEKLALIPCLKKNGYIVIHPYDNNIISTIKEHTNKKIIIVGDGNNKIEKFRYEDITHSYLDIQLQGKKHSLTLSGVYGIHQCIPLITALVTAQSIEILDIKRIKKWRVSSGRGYMLNGIFGSTIIDESYNASPVATLAGLKAFNKIPSQNKLLVLGAMKELGIYSEEAHKNILKAALRITPYVVVIGDEFKNAKQVLHCTTYKEAIIPIKKILKEQSDMLVLVKGSQSARLEKIVKAILRNNKDATHLVRQDTFWK